jgi:hypothetical protein
LLRVDRIGYDVRRVHVSTVSCFISRNVPKSKAKVQKSKGFPRVYSASDAKTNREIMSEIQAAGTLTKQNSDDSMEKIRGHRDISPAIRPLIPTKPGSLRVEPYPWLAAPLNMFLSTC